MSRLIYEILADITLVVHLLFICFVVAGGFIVRRRPWAVFVHLASAAWAIYVEISPGIICPLTFLENYFGYRGGLKTYQEDFIMRYLVPVIYPDNLTVVIQYSLAGLVVLINLIAYAPLWKKK